MRGGGVIRHHIACDAGGGVIRRHIACDAGGGGGGCYKTPYSV